MRGRLVVLCAAWVGAGLLSTRAWAQGGGSCEVILDTAGVVRQLDLGPGRTRQIASGGARWRCVGQETRMWADSAIRYAELLRIDFIGSVGFRDNTVELTADRGSYHEDDDRLEAYGNVRLVNRVTGSVLAGPRLVYRRAVSGVRDTADLYATGRPRVEYRSEGDTAEPYVIIGERVRLQGNRGAWAAGTVTIDRSDFAAKGDSVILDLDAGEGFLIGHAELGGTDSLGYTLRGRRIAYRLVDDQLTWVQSQGLADATSSEWRIVGDTIEFEVVDDMIQAGTAWGDSTRPRAMSQAHTITADSLAVDLPNQELTEVRAFGNAVATSKTDSLDIEADWMAGDTVIAWFGSTESGARTLAKLVAAGNAHAFYRIYNEEDSSAAPGLNYSRGLRITAVFKAESLERVDVVGEADGIHLAPLRRRPW